MNSALSHAPYVATGASRSPIIIAALSVASFSAVVYFIVSIFILILVYRLGRALKEQGQLARQVRAEAETDAGAEAGLHLSLFHCNGDKNADLLQAQTSLLPA